MLCTTLATLAIAITPGMAGLENDPSLAITPASHYTTTAQQLPTIVLVQDEALLTWDAATQTFALASEGVIIDDLVTDIDERGYPSFRGAFTPDGEPLIYGSVLGGESWDVYQVEFTRPNRKPHLFSVIQTADGPTPGAPAKECDCENNIYMGCKTRHCNKKLTCPDMGIDEKCEWQDEAGS